MSSEFLEKIRNVIVSLLVLFISILNTWIAFETLPVHAAESNGWSLSSNAGIYKWEFIEIFEDDQTYMTKALMTLDASDQSYFYAFVRLPSDSYTSGFEWRAVRYKIGQDYDISKDQNSLFFTENPMLYEFSYRFGKESTDTQTDSVVRIGDGEGVSLNFNNRKFHSLAVVPFLPCFESFDALRAFCVSGDSSGLLNGGSVDNPDFEDTAYSFTGFTANNKMTATWTGTTERSYLQDQEVEEYVRVNYYFADKEAQDTIKQADAYPDEFATADKTLTIDVSGLKPDDENWFLRYVRITPCYRQAGLGAWGDFYHGSDVYVYFDLKGNIEKVIHKSKPTDLNKGNMVYDSSIGYLQNVIYTEQKTHDGTGRQATFKWSTQKSLPSDAQVEIVAQNFYIEWFNKKTEENFIFKEYGEDCFYSAGSYSFNANTPVWTWLKEKEIDPFSIKTQSYGSTEYYLRIVIYDESDLLYHYGGWVKVDIKSKDTTNLPSTDVETGGFDDSSGLWNQDTNSSDSYHYSTDGDGKLTGNIDVNSWEDLNMNSFTWMYRNMQSMVSSLGEFPTMVNAVFGYLPVQYITAIGVLLVAIVLLRFLGR